MKKRNNKKAQAQILTIASIILLTLAAFVIVWNVVHFTVDDSSEQIGIDIFTNQFEISNAEVLPNGDFELKIRRLAGDTEITELKFIFTNENGETITKSKTNNLPDKLETSMFTFEAILFQDFTIRKISIVPIFKEKAGIVKLLSPTKVIF